MNITHARNNKKTGGWKAIVIGLVLNAPALMTGEAGDRVPGATLPIEAVAEVQQPPEVERGACDARAEGDGWDTLGVRFSPCYSVRRM